MIRRSFGLLVVVVTLAGGLAACSSSGDASPQASASANVDSQHILELGRRFSQCAREHGYPDFPDPVLDAHGDRPVYPGGPDLKEQTSAVAQIPECKAIDEQIAAIRDANVPAYTAAELQKLREFAQCLRDHGLTGWPDPNADGKFPISGTPLESEGKSDRVLVAIDACKPYWDQGIGVS